MSDECTLIVHAALSRYLRADSLYPLRALIVLLVEELTMQLLDIALECLRDDAGAALSYDRLAPGIREAAGIAHVELAHHADRLAGLLPAHIGGYHLQHDARHVRERRRVRLLHLVKAQTYDLPLALCTRVVIVHIAQTRVCYRLYSVQMIHARMCQMERRDAGSLDGLGDERVDIVELSLGQLHVHAAQHIDRGRDSLPVKCHILRDIQIEILIERLDCQLGAAVAVRGIDLVIFAVARAQICISENADQLDFPGLTVDIGHDDDIGVVALARRVVTRVYAEYGYRPESLVHLLYILDGEVRVLDSLDIYIGSLDLVVLSLDKCIRENADEHQHLRYGEDDDAPHQTAAALGCLAVGAA